MKRTFFAISLVALLSLLMAACASPTEPAEPVDSERPAVDISPDGKTVTLRIDGGGTDDRSAARSLTLSNAKLATNFYEVVFWDGTTVARTSWSIGQQVSIQNVPRGTAGITYDNPTPNAVAPFFTSGHGMAALFVGNSDGTLLGVGMISSVNTGGVLVKDNTTSVTFTVTALTGKAGGTTSTGTSSFLTNALFVKSGGTDGVNSGNTIVHDKINAGDGTTFPIYELPFKEGQETVTVNVKAQYTIGGPSTADLLNTIIVQSVPSSDMFKQPAYYRGGVKQYIGPQTASPSVTWGTTLVAGKPFVPAVDLTFGVDKDASCGVTMFCLDIPVYAVINTGTPAARTWHIRPGYGENLYLIDDGKANAFGGGIYLGVGDVNSLAINITGP